jgi:hypothetical protein
MGALGYGWRDIEAALGLPSGYTEVGDFPTAEKLRILSREPLCEGASCFLAVFLDGQDDISPVSGSTVSPGGTSSLVVSRLLRRRLFDCIATGPVRRSG